MVYEDEEGSYIVYSNIFGLVVVIDDFINEDFESYDGMGFGMVISKSIWVKFEDVDWCYLYVVIVVVCFIGGVLEVFCIVRVFIIGQMVIYDYMGNEGVEILLFEEVFLDKVVYFKVKILDLLENWFYFGNFIGCLLVNWQQYVNQIKVSWIFDELVSFDGMKGLYKDEVIIYNCKGFMFGEVYVLYVVLNFIDGFKFDVFYIFGRVFGIVIIKGQQVDEWVMMGYVLNDLNVQEYCYDFCLNENVRYFQFWDISGVDGMMGYWENILEIYLDNV